MQYSNKKPKFICLCCPFCRWCSMTMNKTNVPMSSWFNLKKELTEFKWKSKVSQLCLYGNQLWSNNNSEEILSDQPILELNLNVLKLPENTVWPLHLRIYFLFKAVQSRWLIIKTCSTLIKSIRSTSNKLSVSDCWQIMYI